MDERAYPLPPASEDPRFTVGLAVDVGADLEEHGYPQPTGLDLVRLQQALYQFIYVGSPKMIRPAIRAAVSLLLYLAGAVVLVAVLAQDATASYRGVALLAALVFAVLFWAAPIQPTQQPRRPR